MPELGSHTSERDLVLSCLLAEVASHEWQDDEAERPSRSVLAVFAVRRDGSPRILAKVEAGRGACAWA